MKLVDFLEQFTPEKFDWNKANEAWDEITTKHKVECQDSGTGDWIEVAPMLTDLLNLIKAGAFEDYPRKITLTRTFTYEGKMSTPCCFTNSPGATIDSEAYDPPIEMKPATVDPDLISKTAVLKKIDDLVGYYESRAARYDKTGDSAADYARHAVLVLNDLRVDIEPNDPEYGGS